MKFLLDQGLPRFTSLELRKQGIDAIHVGDAGMASASDEAILQLANQENRIVVTLDADFHALLALSAARAPSVIRVRIEGLRAEGHAQLLAQVIAICEQDLLDGAMVTVAENGIRIRKLPLLR